jgi:nucleotide-binding universal stress UspA family protein
MRVLVAIDGSKYSDAAVQSVAERGHSPASEVKVLHVIAGGLPISPEVGVWGFGAPALFEVTEEQRQAAKELVTEASDVLHTAGWKVSTSVVEGDPKSLILDLAEQWNADLIVVGSHGRRGLDRFLLGSVSEAVARHARCSVEIVRIPAP